MFEVGANLEAVDHGLDRVFGLLVEFRCLVQFDHGAVDAGTDEPLAAQLLDDLLVLALAAINHRRQQHPGRAFVLLQRLVDHLTDRLRDQLAAVVWAGRNPRSREQQAQVVVDLRHGAHGRARVMRRGFLLDGDGGR